MPGWRLGWIVAPANCAQALNDYLINLFLVPSSLSQHAALAAFDDMPELVETVAQYARNRDRLLAELPRLGLVGIAPPDGAFYLYADVGHLTDDSLAFCRRLVEETGVAIAPGIDFDPIARPQPRPLLVRDRRRRGRAGAGAARPVAGAQPRLDAELTRERRRHAASCWR